MGRLAQTKDAGCSGVRVAGVQWLNLVLSMSPCFTKVCNITMGKPRGHMPKSEVGLEPSYLDSQ